MRTIILALIALVSLASIPASAQPYGGGWRYYEEGDGRDFGPSRYRRSPREYDRWDYGPPRSRLYERRRPYGYRYGWQQRFGRVCVTARGNCGTRPGPLNSPCGCYIRGFGPKRGAIGF